MLRFGAPRCEFRRPPTENACAQDAIRFFTIKRHVRRVSGIDDTKHFVLIDILVRALTQRADCLEAGDRKQPRINSRATFKLVRRTPDIKEYLTDEIVDDRRIANPPLDKSENFFTVASKHDVHGRFVPVRNVL